MKNSKVYTSSTILEERFRATFEQAAVGIAHVSPKGEFIRINQKFCDIVGYDPDKLVTMTFQEITHPDDLDHDISHVKMLLKGEISTYSIEKRYFRKDNSIVWVKLTVSLVRDLHNQPDYFVSVVEDIDEKKKAELELLDYQRQLKTLTNRLARAEEIQRHQLAMDLHDSVGQLLASSRLQLAALNDTMKKSIILGRVNAVSLGLKDAIKFTREIIYNLYPPQLEEMGLVPALEEWIKKVLEKKKGISFSIKADDQKFPLEKEITNLLFRSVQELIVNVTKHASASKVSVDINMREKDLYISVADDGRGFAYDPHSEEYGFGLFSINERMEGVGGKMSIESRPGKGTKIELLIPIFIHQND